MITFLQLNEKYLEKQKQISEKLNLVAGKKEDLDVAEKNYETIKAKVGLQIELANPDMAEGKITRRITVDSDVQIRWAEYIIAKSEKTKLDMVLKALYEEKDTLEQLGNNLKRDKDLGGGGHETDGMGNVR